MATQVSSGVVDATVTTDLSGVETQLSGVETQIAVQNLRSVINNNLAYIRAVDAVADEFGNEGGVNLDVDGTTDATDTHSTHISASGTVSAHSESSASPAWEALDGVIGSDNNMWQPVVHNGSGWFQYAWSSPKRLVTYKIQCRNHRNGSPNAWTMQGSHTGAFAGEQTTVDTVSGVDMVANTNYSFTCDVSTTKYAYHRIVFTQCTVNEGPQFQGIEYFVGAETGNSLNQTYNSSGDYYHNPGSEEDGTKTVHNQGNGSLTMFDASWAVSNNKVVDRIAVHSLTANTSMKVKIALANSNTDLDIVYSEAVSHGGTGWETFTLTTSYTIPASGIYRTGVYGGGINYSMDSEGGSRSYIGGDATGSAGVYTFGSGSGSSWGTSMTKAITNPSAMTLVSNTFTAETAPAESSAVFLHQPVDAVTLNTDILGYISRDAGTTWTQGTLVDAGSFDSTTNILTMNAVDISGQPSGTSMRYKIVTANAKEQRLHGAWLAWS